MPARTVTKKATKTTRTKAAKARASAHTPARSGSAEAPPAPRGYAVVATGLTKRFGDFVAVDGIDLSIPRGTCFGLLGPNGAGKTTTIKMMACVSPVTSGDLRVLDLDTRTDRRRIKARLGVVPQEDNLDPDFTVHKNLTTYARFYKIDRTRARQRADELLSFVQLEEKRDARIQELSGGMKRRLIVARSLLNDPELLVLDEPTTGLDPQARHTIWDKIRRLKREGKTVLLTTHYMDEAEKLCDHLVVIDHGKIIAHGAPKDLIAEHTGGETVEFVAGPDDTKTLDAVAETLAAGGTAHERLSDRILAYAADGQALQKRILARHHLPETILRRATLEDVFLRLTGRALRD